MALDTPILMDGVEIDNIENDEAVETSYTYKIDWDTGRIIGMIDGVGAVEQFVKKAILTPRFKCLIYDAAYGSEIHAELADSEVTNEYIEADMKRLVKEAIGNDERILDIESVQYLHMEKKDEAFVRITLNTIFGVSIIEGVIR